MTSSVAKLQELRAAAQKRSLRSTWPLLILATAGLALASPPRARIAATVTLPPAPKPTPRPAPVFLVEHQPEADLYSNGLQIRTAFQTTSAPRVYKSFDRATFLASPLQTTPAGIVFHTTESLVAPIEPDQVAALNRGREDVLAHVRRDHLYNFVVDRFGQVFRVVPEDQVAYHAGHSVWADSGRVFIDLNESFLGISFEMKEGETATPAQLISGRLLTQMLRATYNIADANCVTHAQVSVNPDNLRIGYHTDWGGGFPFSELGLAAGYRAPVAAVEVFGFGYDEHLLGAIGGRPWAGLLAAEQQILIDAAAHGSLGPRYRTTLQHNYQTLRRLNYERP